MAKLIAELSMNHGGDMELAEKMISAAAASGADYVKFQTWKCDRLKPGPWDTDGRRDWYEKSELNYERHEILSGMCKKYNTKFLSSCFNSQDLDLVRQFSDEVKIPSTECTNIKLVESAIEKFNKVYISTGATEIKDFAAYARHKHVYLLHCVSLYPCPYDKVNLPRIHKLSCMTDNFGYSGHSLGIWDAIAAISMGCTVVEKHFTTDKKLPFRDNAFSILPEELSLIRDYSNIFDSMNMKTSISDEERAVRNQFSGRWGYENTH